MGSRVVEEITSRGGETRSDINAPLNPLTSKSLEHREQVNALYVSSSVEMTHNEPDADGITLEKPHAQEPARRKPSSDITTEENSSDEEYIPETIPSEKSPANSSSVDPAHHIIVKQAPTWSTFSSLTGEPLPIWNVWIAAPLYRRSPTEWHVLLTILMQAHHINCITVGDGSKPIVNLDGDLYDRAVKLKDYKDNLCIKLGALHITVAALKCLGKYIEGSCLESAWETAGVYGSATVRQILDGRHIYRGLEAHMMTLFSLHTVP